VTVIRFPPHHFAAVFVLESADGWLVLAPRGQAWLHATRAAALADAKLIARDLDLPVRDEVV
jgi:hypothetical protein